MYMSPQVLLGEAYTIKCDVWSLGVLFYKVLFDVIPWEKNENIVKLASSMQQELVVPPKPEIDNWLKNLIKGMLMVDESNRFSIKQVRDIIEKNCKIEKMEL